MDNLATPLCSVCVGFPVPTERLRPLLLCHQEGVLPGDVPGNINHRKDVKVSPGSQILNQYEWRHLVAKFVTNATRHLVANTW